ncbi:MAG: hypothetical protein ABF296_10080 [Oceanococcaceae bacterium]
MSRWTELQHEAQAARGTDWRVFSNDPAAVASQVVCAAGLRLDQGREQLRPQTWTLLYALAEKAGLQAQRAAQWSGEVVNRSEQRRVLHGALRSPERAPAAVAAEVRASEQQVQALVSALAETRPGAAVLHIGIGGSDLGPRLAADVARLDSPALRPLHFLNNLDDATLAATLAALDPADVIVVLVSKSYSTAETLELQQRVNGWLEAADVDPAAVTVAVTSNAARARETGVPAERILDLPEWVGGRYSVWSAVSVSIALAFGPAARERLRAGAAAMDTHFLDTPLEANLPARAALCGVWHANALAYDTRVVVPYADALKLLPEYLQQLEMESNGKRVDQQGRPLGHATAPATLGGVGSCAQHAFFQLLHQSDAVHPVEFVLPARVAGVAPEMQRQLLANALAQACALTHGRDADGPDETRCCPGQRPSTLIGMAALDLWHLGALLAFYEHRTAVQGWIWGLNSYDQFGVEIGKTIAGTMQRALQGDEGFPDAASAAAGEWFRGQMDALTR